MKNPLVSIILPVYNNIDDVLNAINSVIDQTYTNWELIIVDDNSSDGTYELLCDFIKKKKDPRLILKRNKKNLGCYISMNIGIINSKGKYITRIDSDDKFVKNKLEIQVNILELNNNLVAVETYYKRGDKIILCNCVTLMYKRDVINTMGYYDSVRFGADTEFKFRIYKTFGFTSIFRLKKVLYNAQIRKNSLTRNKKTGSKTIRLKYTDNFKNWHKSLPSVYMNYPLKTRPFYVDPIMLP